MVPTFRRVALTRSVALVAIAGIPLILSACSSSPSHGNKTASSTSGKSGKTGTTVTPSTEAATTTQPSSQIHPTSGTVPPGQTPPPVCTAKVLQATEGSQGISGTDVTANITLENTSSKACSLSGYPTISLTGAGGVAQASKVIQGGVAGLVGKAPVVTISLAANGGQASFGASWYPLNNEPACDDTMNWILGIPGVTGTIDAPIEAPVCNNGVINVTPLEPNLLNLKG